MTTLEIGKVVLNVADLERMTEFYQNRLGLTITERGDGWVSLGAANDNRALLKLIEIENGVNSTGGTGLYHFAILVPARRDLAQVLKHFAHTQTPLQGLSDHFVSEAIYLADPEGNGIEIYADRPRATWEYNDGELNIGTVALDIDDLMRADDKKKPTWDGMPSGTIMGHVHLHVSNIPDAEHFYHDLLGFDIMMRYHNMASFISRDGYHHHMGLNTWKRGQPSAITGNTLGLKWFELKFHDLPQVLKRLEEVGLTTEKVEDGYLVRDPVQNGVLLQSL